jgi:hypothetical protein
VVIAWLLFPLVVVAVCLGSGLLVERISGWQLPGAVLPSVGLALVIVVSSLTTTHELTAPLTTPVVVLVALAGFASSWARVRSMRPDRWALGVAVGVFAVCAAPVVLSGSAGFLGYFVLNDGVFHFALINQLLAHAQDLSRLGSSSTLFSILHSYIDTSYPVGADVALGAVRPLVGQNVAWIFTPFLAVIMALGAVALYELIGGVVRSRALRAACAFIAGQAGLAYGYYLQGSIKELATAWIIPVTVVLVFATLRERLSLRRMAPLALSTVAGLYVLNLAIVPWLAPPLAAFAVVAGWRTWHTRRPVAPARLALWGAGGLAVIALIAAPLISSASTFFNVATGVLTQPNDLGNLFSPLPKWEMFGIWPVGDFRSPVIVHYRIAYALIGVAAASAILGTIWAVRRRAMAPLLLLAGNGVAVIYLLNRGSPYANAKVMMVFSITLVLVAMLGGAALYDAGRRVEGWLLAGVIAGGVLWTNALGYHDASVAPRDRLDELASIGTRFAGKGPAFYNLSDEYAVDFLSNEKPIDPALSPPPPRPGFVPTEGRQPWDTDNVSFAYVESFPLLVLGRSPRFSRPPANYQLAYQGRYYDVWKRTSAPQVLEHIPLGGPLYPFAVPPCRLVTATAARATHENARLAYVAREPFPTFVPTQANRPPNWGLVGGDPFSLLPRDEAGAASGTVQVARPGRYQVWLEGSFSQRLRVSVGGKHVGSVAYELGPPGQSVRVGEVTLGAGEQPVVVVRPGNNLTPGDGGVGRLLGPLMLVGDNSPPGVSEIAPSQARSLCGQSLDWLEIVR